MRKWILIWICCGLVGWNIGFYFSTPIIHSYYWLLRKTGIRPSAQYEILEDGAVYIDKLDPGENIIIKIPVKIEKEDINEITL